MGWQTTVVVQLLAGNTIINATGVLTYSGPPAAGNLSSSETPASGVDSFGNFYLAGVSSYGSTIATQMGSGFITFYTGSLAGGWSAQGTIATDSLGDLLVSAASGRSVLTTNNTLDDGSGNFTAGGTGTFNGSGITVGNGASANLTLVPKMATPPNLAAVIANTATLAQTQTCLGAIVQSMQNRNMVN